MTARRRSLLVLAVKLLVAAGLIYAIVTSDKMRGMRWDDLSVVLDRWPLLVWAVMVLSSVPMIGALRWYALMRCQGFGITFRRSLHLTLVGVFFNCVGVGYTGGDVIKAYYAARDQERGRRAEAVYAVGFDRAVGLFGLMLLGALALLLGGREVWADPRLRGAALAMAGAVLTLALAFLLLWSRRVRENTRLGQTIERLPGGRLLLRFYRSVAVFRSKSRTMFIAVVLSMLGHAVTVFFLWLLGTALAMPELPPLRFALCVAVGLAVSAVGPPMGLGFGQYAFATLFGLQWGERGTQFGFLLACLQQVVIAGFNVTVGLPAFLSVRRELSQVRAEMQADELADAAPASRELP